MSSQVLRWQVCTITPGFPVLSPNIWCDHHVIKMPYEGFGHFPLESFRFFNMKIIRQCLVFSLLYAAVFWDYFLITAQSPCVIAVPAGKIDCVSLLTSRNTTLAERVTVLFAVEAQAGAVQMDRFLNRTLVIRWMFIRRQLSVWKVCSSHCKIWTMGT